MKTNGTYADFEEVRSQVKTPLDLEILKYTEDEKAKSVQKGKWVSSPLIAIVLSAVFALLGTGLGAWLQGQSNIKLEKQKFEADLILKMLETNDQDKAVLNLEFLIKTGLIENDTLKTRIQGMIHNKKLLPTLGINEARSFQQSNGLTPDGIVGPQTLKKTI